MTPHEEYKKRLGERSGEVERLRRLSVRTGNLRLAVAVMTVAAGFAAFGQHWFSPLWLAPLLAVFIALIPYHDRVDRAAKTAQQAAAFYNRGLERLEGRWQGTGQSGERFRDPEHPYADDLDLFGTGGLFELISAARTRMGEETLARWLLSPSNVDVLAARHKAVDELRDRVDLREELAVIGAALQTGVHPQALVTWADSPTMLPGGGWRIVVAVLSVATLAAFVYWALFDVPSPLLLMLLVDAAVGLRLRDRVRRVAGEVEQAAHDLDVLSAVLARLEQQRFLSPRLAEMRAALDTAGKPPSRQIHRLRRLVELLDSRDNVAMRMIGPPLFYTTQLAYAIDAWRRESGASIHRWLEAAGEMEALLSLAGYAYEHPQDPFPEFTLDGPVFEGAGLRHPLLGERAVPNDVTLGGEARLLIVSGSNMSGKSTLLRTVGVNAVLALAGGPVRAARLRIQPVAVGASIRISDSLQGGISRFYAEITRIRKLVDLAASGPLIFLLDELLHGTNSHDRRIGADAILRALIARGAAGIATTHDLALADIASEPGVHARNVHFEDHLEAGQMRFDYVLRDGVVTKSNALELMRSVGLEV